MTFLCSPTPVAPMAPWLPSLISKTLRELLLFALSCHSSPAPFGPVTHFQNTLCVPGSVLGPGDPGENKIGRSFHSWGKLAFYLGRD